VSGDRKRKRKGELDSSDEENGGNRSGCRSQFHSRQLLNSSVLVFFRNPKPATENTLSLIKLVLEIILSDCKRG
jgi:hypothetical protein